MNVITMVGRACVKVRVEGNHQACVKLEQMGRNTMSVRAWLVRRQIQKIFRPKPLQNAPIEERAKKVINGMRGSETQLPQPPKTTEIIKVDEEYGGVSVRGEWVSEPDANPDRIIFYSHGGGYVWGAPAPYRDLAWRLSRAANARVFLLDYTLAPTAHCPTQINEGLAAYDMIREASPNASISMSGDSAGGGLTAALAIAIRDSERAAPASVSLISPWLDLTGSGESLKTNDKTEVMLDPEGITVTGSLYRGELPADDPRVSPLFAKHENLPPILIQVSSSEILLDDSVRFEHSVKSAGGSVDMEVWKNMHHVWHMSAAIVPEGKKAIKAITAHFEKYWDTDLRT
jgi:acetyl esterase/lipase